MAQVARVGPAQREQDVQVGDVEVGVVRRGPADLGAEPEVATQQGREVGPGAGFRAVRGGVPEAVRGDPVLLGCEVCRAYGVPAAGGRRAAVGQREEQQPAIQVWPVRSM